MAATSRIFQRLGIVWLGIAIVISGILAIADKVTVNWPAMFAFVLVPALLCFVLSWVFKPSH